MKCKWCDLGWELGRFGCHYEPLPPDWDDDEFMGRMKADCQNWEEMRLQFYGTTSHRSLAEKAHDPVSEFEKNYQW